MAEIITAKHTSESGHWYQQDGTPAYTIIGKNGNERPTTLRDARKLALVPSVTTIIGMGNKPGLTNWLIDQHIMSALTCHHIEGETNDELIARIKQDAQEQAKKAREKGTQIHAWVQNYFEGKQLPDEALQYCLSARDIISNLDISSDLWICEKSFAYDGYGGKCDLHTDKHVIDIKTTDKPIADLKTWDEHAMQIAAYRHGLGIPNTSGGILYINTIDASARLVMIDESDIRKGHGMFMALKDYWYAKTGL